MSAQSWTAPWHVHVSGELWPGVAPRQARCRAGRRLTARLQALEAWGPGRAGRAGRPSKTEWHQAGAHALTTSALHSRIKRSGECARGDPAARGGAAEAGGAGGQGLPGRTGAGQRVEREVAAEAGDGAEETNGRVPDVAALRAAPEPRRRRGAGAGEVGQLGPAGRAGAVQRPERDKVHEAAVRAPGRRREPVRAGRRLHRRAPAGPGQRPLPCGSWRACSLRAFARACGSVSVARPCARSVSARAGSAGGRFAGGASVPHLDKLRCDQNVPGSVRLGRGLGGPARGERPRPAWGLTVELGERII